MKLYASKKSVPCRLGTGVGLCQCGKHPTLSSYHSLLSPALRVKHAFNSLLQVNDAWSIDMRRGTPNFLLIEEHFREDSLVFHSPQ